MAYFIEIAAGVVLSPELVGKTVGEILKGGESRVNVHGLGNKSAQIINFPKSPPTLNEVGFEKSLARLLQQLDDRFVGTFELIEEIGGTESRPRRTEPVQGIIFISFQMSLIPRVAISV